MKNKKSRYLLVFLAAVFILTSLSISFANVSENSDSEIVSDDIEYDDVQDDGYEAGTEESSDVDVSSEKIDSKAGVYYTVKKGDTLWDLSRRFKNDSWKWPGMWGANNQLTNPHLIYPGQRIRLFKRHDIEQIKNLEKSSEEVKTTENIEEVPEFVEPDETDKSTENVDNLEIDPTPESITQDEGPISLPFYHYSKINSVGFMKKKPFKEHGYIFKVRGIERLMIQKGDEVYIKESKGFSLTPGAKYHTYETLSPRFIKNKLKKSSVFGKKTEKTYVGTQHVLTGVVEITGKKSGYAIAKIVQSYRTIRLKNYVMPYTKRSADITLTGSVEGLNGKIISSEGQEGMFGDDKIVFIDKGSNNGVKIGQMYNIFYPEEKDSAEFLGGERLFITVDFASFIVLHTEEKTSTVLITSAYKSISAGDKWHYPQE